MSGLRLQAHKCQHCANIIQGILKCEHNLKLKPNFLPAFCIIVFDMF